MDFDGIVLFTTCTNRKRRPIPNALRASSLLSGSQDSILHQWCERLSSNSPVGKASEIYGGRGYREASKASEEVSGPLWVISAGLGLVSEEAQIPSYSLTIADAVTDGILKKVRGKQFSPTKWWWDLTSFQGSSNPIHGIIKANPSKLFVMALSKSYATLIQQDLLNLSDGQIQQIRLIGLAIRPILDARLQKVVMPYDARLDGPDGINTGTRSDFSQRAMRHFVSEIADVSNSNDPETHALLVNRTLSGYSYPQTPRRRRMPDDQIANAIVENWATSGGNSSKMLRIIRNDKGIACEQGRFRKIFNHVKEKVLS